MGGLTHGGPDNAAMIQMPTQETQSLSHTVHLFIDCDGRKAGGCCIDFGAKALVLIEDVVGDGDDLVSTVDSLFTQMEPTKSAQQYFSYDMLKAKMFSGKQATRFIDDLLDLCAETESNSEGVSVHVLLSELKFAKELAMARNSFAALAQSLENLTIMDEVPYALSSYIKSVKLHTLSDYLYMDRDSYCALQIFSNPVDQKRSGMSNSVFDYMNLTGSPLGCNKLKQWFNSPLADIIIIKERQHTLRVLLDQGSSKYVDELILLQKRLGNISHTLSSISTSKSSISHWVNLDRFLRTGIEMVNLVAAFTSLHETSIGKAILEYVDLQTFKELLLDITTVIDFDASRENERVYIKDGLDPRLDELRRKYTGLEQVLQSLAVELFEVHTQFSEDVLNVVYIPQLGYLISIDLSAIQAVPITWVEVFKTVTTAYYKDAYMNRMDEEYDDIYQLMIDYEIELLHLLQSKIVDRELDKPLLRASSLFAELDCFLSLASVAMLHDFVEPEMVEDSILFIDGGRHIIVEQAVNSFVPNKTMIPEETLSIITGANASGKSVYLTHIGIIVFLAHIGSYVPASRASIGVTDKLLTRIVTREAIDKCESTFFIDLQKMSKCLSMCTPKSIMLVDEFGKGTDVLGGPSLLGSIIERLASSGVTSRTIITTHFHELFKDGILKDVQKVKRSHMDVQLSKKGDGGITYLYQLKEGLCDNSFGIECAQVCGIPQSIIQRAREISAQRHDGQRVSQELDQARVERAKLVTKEFLLWDIPDDMPIDELRGRLAEILEGVQNY